MDIIGCALCLLDEIEIPVFELLVFLFGEVVDEGLEEEDHLETGVMGDRHFQRNLL